MSIVNSFAPVARTDAKILILGSMPGKVSLAQQQYYAHPRNLFWPIMEEVCDMQAASSYETRLAKLQEHGIALWDVMRECYRVSALDADIVENSIIANNFAEFLSVHRQIRRICFNGKKAEQAFRRYALAQLPDTIQYELTALPSTSPANASISQETRRRLWLAAFKTPPEPERR